LALLYFTELYENQLPPGVQTNLKAGLVDTQSNAPSDSDFGIALGNAFDSYKDLDTTLRNALELGKPLYRWNELPDAVRPLLSALRANLLAFFSTLGSYMATTRQASYDFSRNELAERPWDMVFRGIPSDHRFHFTLAAYRGLVQGEPHLKKASSFILCLSLAKCRSSLNFIPQTLLIACCT
jgi:hypothetical protein